MIIRNRFFPFTPFSAINFCGIIFVRKGLPFSPTDLRHELIHSRQQRELLYIPFFVLYLSEWLWHLLQTRPLHHLFRAESLLRAYFRISFEREAYAHQKEPDYLCNRTLFAWFRYL